MWAAATAHCFANLSSLQAQNRPILYSRKYPDTWPILGSQKYPHVTADLFLYFKPKTFQFHPTIIPFLNIKILCSLFSVSLLVSLLWAPSGLCHNQISSPVYTWCIFVVVILYLYFVLIFVFVFVFRILHFALLLCGLLHNQISSPVYTCCPTNNQLQHWLHFPWISCHYGLPSCDY